MRVFFMFCLMIYKVKIDENKLKAKKNCLGSHFLMKIHRVPILSITWAAELGQSFRTQFVLYLALQGRTSRCNNWLTRSDFMLFKGWIYFYYRGRGAWSGWFLSDLNPINQCHKVNTNSEFLFIYATQILRPYIFRTMNFFKSYNLSLK